MPMWAERRFAMRLEEIKRQVDLKEFADAHLERKGTSYICPICHSGKGPNGTPAFSIQPNVERWKCFSCGNGGDVFTLAGAVSGTDDVMEQADIVKRWANIRDEDARSEPSGRRARAFDGAPIVGMPEDGENANMDSTKVQKAYREREIARVERWRANIDHPDAAAYLQSRGRTVEWARAHGFGYNPSAPLYRLIIPWKGAPWYHIDRDVTGTAKHKYDKPRSNEVGKQPLYNAEAIETARTVFIVEGVFDAIAVEDCSGIPAIAIGSNRESANGPICSALTALQESRRPNVLIIADRDDMGMEGANALKIHLLEAGVERVSIVEPPSTIAGKDADEMERSDRAAFGEWLQATASEAERQEREGAEERYNTALERMHILNPAETAMDLMHAVDLEQPVPTGLKSLDDALDGGFCRGVVVMGAISSLGKTTLMLQLADNIAEMGHPVLFVTVEQSAKELVSKSLCRFMRKEGYRVSDTDVRGYRRTTWSGDKNEAFAIACDKYSERVAPRMKVLEGTEQPSVADIWAVADRMTEHDGVAPIVFIDYLQLLKPLNDRLTDKQATDKNMTLLRQMARELKTTIVVISSLNRASYSGVIDLDSFKESGAIEYGSDILMGLQPDNMVERINDRAQKQSKESRVDELIKGTKRSDPRELEIVILKNRFGRTPHNGVTVTMDARCSAVFDGPKSNMPRVGE